MIMREWLLFTAQTPASPSSLRVLVWRRMQHLGALLLHNGLWILPHTSNHVQAIQDLATEIEAHGGYGCFFFAQPGNAALGQHVIARFQAEREKEYAEFAERCTSFLNELERETAAQKFTFAELEENEDDLHKLTAWLHKIQARDFFGCQQHDAATAMLARCNQTLGTFTASIYEQAGLTTPALTLSSEDDQEEEKVDDHSH